VADELAAAADLVKGKVSHVPAAVVRGSGWATEVVGAGARSLVRTGREDWFGLGRVEAVRSALGVPPGSPAALEDGIASVAPEVVAERVARAVRVALRGSPDAAVDVGPGHLRVQADSGYQLGVAVSRLRTALWGEGVEVPEPAEPTGLEAVLHLPTP
jgi:coenzyme F420-0:L-glutamate ligase/coenzyme F420-1:gamma-L-glutamate ligase